MNLRLGSRDHHLEACLATGARRTIVLTFDHPVDAGRVTANDNISGG